jgi:SAM-dependent methyltransferase
MESATAHAAVQDYYGRVLASTADLKTTACCSTEDLPTRYKAVLALLPDEVLARFYGCGSPIPAALEGATVLDLGCGTGRDAFVAAAMAGPEGHVIGLDMTDEQLEVARRHEATVAERLGFDRPTTRFVKGYMEDLAAAGIESESVDVVISNCVLNLSPDKPRVFAELLRVLKPGGELYVSDVFCDRRLPASAMADPVLLGECLGGAMYTEDFRRLLAGLGVPDYRTVSERPIEITDDAIRPALGPARFVSRTVRAFKLRALEDLCEDYGQIATYRGGAPGQEHAFRLDDHHLFEAHRPERVCGNTAAMLQDTRFAAYFEVTGDRSRHFGAYPCGPTLAHVDGEATAGSCC